MICNVGVVIKSVILNFNNRMSKKTHYTGWNWSQYAKKIIDPLNLKSYWKISKLENWHLKLSLVYLMRHTANISLVKYTTCTLCLFPSGTTDAVSTTDCSMLRIVVLWQKYNKYVVKFTMISCRRGWDLNPGPLWTY